MFDPFSGQWPVSDSPVCGHSARPAARESITLLADALAPPVPNGRHLYIMWPGTCHLPRRCDPARHMRPQQRDRASSHAASHAPGLAPHHTCLPPRARACSPRLPPQGLPREGCRDGPTAYPPPRLPAPPTGPSNAPIAHPALAPSSRAARTLTCFPSPRQRCPA